MGVLAHALGCVECQPRDGDSEFLTHAHSCVGVATSCWRF